jgi:hypothetical protein
MIEIPIKESCKPKKSDCDFQGIEEKQIRDGIPKNPNL